MSTSFRLVNWNAGAYQIGSPPPSARPWTRPVIDTTHRAHCVFLCYALAPANAGLGSYPRDAVDLQLGHGGKRTGIEAGDLRIVIAPLNGKPAAILMRPIDPAASRDNRVVYHSPVGDKVFDRVEVLTAAQVSVSTTGQGYIVQAAIPLAVLSVKLDPGTALRGDVGIIFSDAAGTANASRAYWSNPNTNLVSDLPQEAWLFPDTWGELKVE